MWKRANDSLWPGLLSPKASPRLLVPCAMKSLRGAYRCQKTHAHLTLTPALCHCLCHSAWGVFISFRWMRSPLRKRKEQLQGCTGLAGDLSISGNRLLCNYSYFKSLRRPFPLVPSATHFLPISGFHFIGSVGDFLALLAAAASSPVHFCLIVEIFVLQLRLFQRLQMAVKVETTPTSTPKPHPSLVSSWLTCPHSVHLICLPSPHFQLKGTIPTLAYLCHCCQNPTSKEIWNHTVSVHRRTELDP